MPLAPGSHHEQGYRWLFHDAVVDTLQPVLPPTHFLRRRYGCAGLIVFDVALVAAETAVAGRSHVKLLSAARAFGAEILQPAEILNVAVVEDVIPSTLVVHG